MLGRRGRPGLSLRESGLPKREPPSYPKMPSDRLPQFYPWPPTTASRPCRRYEKPPHGTRSGSVGILPLAYLAACASASPRAALREARCQDNLPRAQRPATAVLGACHVTRAQRHARGFKAYSRPVRKPDFSAENQHLSQPSHRKPKNTPCRDMVFPPACSLCVRRRAESWRCEIHARVERCTSRLGDGRVLERPRIASSPGARRRVGQPASV